MHRVDVRNTLLPSSWKLLSESPNHPRPARWWKSSPPALRKEHLDPRHEAKSWGDWIYLECYNTVISIEANHGLSSSATIEHGDGEEDGEPIVSILRAFGHLGWHGVDDDGEYPLA